MTTSAARQRREPPRPRGEDLEPAMRRHGGVSSTRTVSRAHGPEPADAGACPSTPSPQTPTDVSVSADQEYRLAHSAPGCGGCPVARRRAAGSVGPSRCGSGQLRAPRRARSSVPERSARCAAASSACATLCRDTSSRTRRASPRHQPKRARKRSSFGGVLQGLVATEDRHKLRGP